MSTELAIGVQAYAAGTVILREGPSSPKVMAIVLQGNVGVFRYFGTNTQRQEKVLTQGNVHGELSLFSGYPPKETLVALTDSAILIVSRKNLHEFFQKQTALAVTVIEDLCRKLCDPDFHAEALLPEEQQTRESSLFPKEQGDYKLPLTNDASLIYPTTTTCPLCGYSFDSLTVFESRLRRDKVDPDQRVRYHELEPLYYEIITCPNCLFSASAGKFEEVERHSANMIMQQVGPYKLEMFIRTGRERDTFTVFAGYYLAILCAPYIYDDHQLFTAVLWLKVSRLYQDVGDTKLFLWATQKALDEYIYCYERLRINEKQSQQVCFMMGEMYFRLGEYDKARQYLFMAKTNKFGTPLMQRQADLRIDDVREAMQAAKDSAEGTTG